MGRTGHSSETTQRLSRKPLFACGSSAKMGVKGISRGIVQLFGIATSATKRQVCR